MCRKEEGNYIEKRVDLSRLQDYEQSGCKLKELLEEWRKGDVRIAFQDKLLEAEWLEAFYRMIIQREQEELKVEQRAGIRRALKKKREGTGRYGRPRVKLPEDFEQQIKVRLRNEEDLSHYCKELDMKKSTFYKWVKVYKDSWK